MPSRAAVGALAFVRAMVPFHPAYQLEAFLADNLDQVDQVFPLQRYNIRVFAAAQKLAAGAKIATIGGQLDSADAGKRLIVATLTPSQLYQVARWDEVLFVDRWSPMEPDMNNVRKLPLRSDGSDGGANYLETVAGYRGSGVHGEVLDAGFNLAHMDSVSRPLIVHGGEVTTSGADAVHGGATSGIIFGDGFGNPIRRGLLPLGQGIVADWGDNLELFYSPNRYDHTAELVNPNLTYKAVFQSTSGGIDLTTNYTNISSDMDDILFDFDLVHCQSQGNFGSTHVSRSQAWAKNIIAVGGVRHLDNLTSSDDCWSCTLSCGLAQSASYGPAADGRVKPDLLFFNDCIYTVGTGTNGDYPDFAGTSAATPIVCGHIGLLMEMWADDADLNGRNIFRVPVPSCNPAIENCVFKRRPHMSTAKAVMIHTAKQYDWVNPPPPGNNVDLHRNKQGWGLPNIATVYDFRNNALIVNETEVFSEFEMRKFYFAVESGDPFLRATLVYTDPPAAPNAYPATVNDLTLKVTAPDGTTTYWGNCGLLNALWSSSACTSGDHPYPSNPTIEVLDTVENVFVQNPTPGTWTVTVRLDAIAQDAHVETPGLPRDADFALVVSSGAVARGQCCVADPLTFCERICTATTAAGCTGPYSSWSSEKTCAEACQFPGEILCCKPTETCASVTPTCCTAMGGYVVTDCWYCPG